MKVSRKWLQTYFESQLPSTEELSRAFTFHAFEVEEVKGEMLDLKVLPDRAGYALSHRGIAKELSAILDLPMKQDPLKEALPKWNATDELEVRTDATYVNRHIGALVRGVTVGPSPDWLREALESVGQRSINNIVDASNFVMLNIGQPTHAFDAEKITKSGSKFAIDIREAREGETVKILTGEGLTLAKDMYVIADGASGKALDVAGVKGGFDSGITSESKTLFLSAGNYDGTRIRRMAQHLKLFTDASQRFQNRPSPELAAYGMRDLIALIQEVAGGELVGVVDVYNKRQESRTVSTSTKAISTLIGRDYSDADVEDAFRRLGFSYTSTDGAWTVEAPIERGDIEIPEDIAEEVGRIIGYEKLESKVFETAEQSSDQKRFRGIERIKDFLVERGFIEVSTQSFGKKGDIKLSNPLDDSNPYLRSSLSDNVLAAMKMAKNYAPLVLPPNVKPKLFEIGNVFTKKGEMLLLSVSEKVEGLEAELGVKPTMSQGVEEFDLSKFDIEKYGEDFNPKRYTWGVFEQFSQYPFVLRDIAVWVPEGILSDVIHQTILEHAGPLLNRCELFDTFSKNGKTSYAYRLVFQSMEKTLSDDEVNGYMKSVTDALNAKEEWNVR